MKGESKLHGLDKPTGLSLQHAQPTLLKQLENTQVLVLLCFQHLGGSENEMLGQKSVASG